jgi:uncharacterized protein YkwD
MYSRRITRLQTPFAIVTLLAMAWSSAWAHCGDASSMEDALRRVNAERAHGVVCGSPAGANPSSPLRWSAGLAAVAAAQAQDMVALHRLGHRDVEERALATRLAAGGYRFSMVVENVAVGYPTADAVIDAWLSSARHCANLMNRTVLELGLACSDASPDAQDRYWTLVLGAPAR